MTQTSTDGSDSDSTTLTLNTSFHEEATVDFQENISLSKQSTMKYISSGTKRSLIHHLLSRQYPQRPHKARLFETIPRYGVLRLPLNSHPRVDLIQFESDIGERVLLQGRHPLAPLATLRFSHPRLPLSHSRYGNPTPAIPPPHNRSDACSNT